MVRGLAHEWSSKTTSKFVETQLGLPAAAEALAAARVNGRGLLLLSDELLQRYGIERPLHRRKILAHADELRDEALAAVNAARSEDPQRWSCWETAAWAAVEKQSPKAAMLVLKRGHTFKSLCAMNKEELQQALKPLPGEERHRIMLELLQSKLRQVQERKAQQQQDSTSTPAPKGKKRRHVPAAEHDTLRVELLATTDQVLVAGDGTNENKDIDEDKNNENNENNENDEDEGSGKEAEMMELPDNDAKSEQRKSVADLESASESAEEHAEDGTQDCDERLGVAISNTELETIGDELNTDLDERASTQPTTATTDYFPEPQTPAPPPRFSPTPSKLKHAQRPKQPVVAAHADPLPKLAPANLTPVPTPLEMMNAVVDADVFTGTVERLRATASEAWADVFEKFKFRSPTVVPAGVSSQSVLCHLADLWLRLGHQLQTTLQGIEPSPAKQCLTALRHSVDGLLPPGSNPHEQVAALTYAYLYFRAKWVRCAGRGSIFETDLSQLTDLQLGQLTRHEFQGEASEVLQLQTPWEQFDSIFRIIDRGKSGTVQLAELLLAFTYPPLPQPMQHSSAAAVSTTELVLLCLILATDSPLADSAPFTSTIQQCIDRAAQDRSGSEISASSPDADTPQTVTASTIASLLAEWIQHSLQPWFQGGSQRQPHRHRWMPNALFSMLKLLQHDRQRQHVCEHFAKLFRIYPTEADGGSGSLVAQVSDFAALLYTFVLFRLSSLRHLLQQQVDVGDESSSELRASVARLQRQLQGYIASYPAHQTCSAKDDDTLEKLVMGLLGICIPARIAEASLLACLSRLQRQLLVYSCDAPAGSATIDGPAATTNDSMLPTPPSSTNGVEGRQSFRTARRTAKKSHRGLHQQLTDLSNTHRASQLHTYIELLEERLHARKVFLRSLCAFCEHFFEYSTDALETAQRCVSAVRVYSSLYNVPVTRLTDQTGGDGVIAAGETLRKLKTHLADELLAPAPSRVQQLEQRIGKLRAGMSAGKIQDEAGVLWAPMNKTSALETEIMQMNNLIFQLFDEAEQEAGAAVLQATTAQRSRAVMLQSATFTQSLAR